MLYSGLLLIGYIALTVGAFVLVRKITIFAFSLFFGDNYTIRYRRPDGTIRTVKLRANRNITADDIIAELEKDRSEEDKPLHE